MRKIIAVALLMINGVVWSPIILAKLSQKFMDKYKSTSHVIHQKNEVEDSNKSCSATAIGPHALLTATHCEVATDLIDIDGVKGYHILSVIRDGNDHSIYILKDIKFKDIAKMSSTPVQVSDEVFIWGNPEMYLMQLRVGKYIGAQAEGGRIIQLFSLAVRPGDSGSGVFNSKGEIVAVTSFLVRMHLPDESKFEGMGAITLNFRAEDLLTASTI